MTTYRVLGHPEPREDGFEKVTGAARYTADTTMPDALWAKALRSSLPHARITGLDASRARALPGVRAILTGEDVRGVRFGRRMRDVPVVADGVVRFAGERVAVVAADDAETAKRAVELIEVEYEELPAVFDPLEAMEDGAPVIHPGVNDYPGLPRPVEGRHLNAVVRDTWGIGDVEEGFARADVIVEGTYTTQRVHQGYLEPHNCVVWLDPQGRLQLWAPNKAPHRLKHDMAEALGIPEAQIVVHHSAIGADFGGKGSPMDMPACYELSRVTGKPVRMAMDYAEELTAANPRHSSVIHIKTGVRADGTIVSHQARLVYNSGAYGGFKPVPGVNLPGASHAGGPYAIPNCAIEALIVYTNTMPCGFFRGPGAVQANFGLESHMDVIAERLDIDPIELRRRNLVGEDGKLPNGLHVPRMASNETLDETVRAAALDQPRPDGVGRGISISYKDQGEGVSSAAVAFHPDGSVVLHTSVFEQGTGSYTMLRQMVAEELGMEPGRIRVEPWDTDDGPFDSGVGASRVTRVATPAVHHAATEARERLIALAADLLMWPHEVTTVAGEHVRRTDTGDTQAWRELLERTGQVIEAWHTNSETEHSPVASFMAQAAEVRVDRETGEVRVLRLTSAHDVAQVYNQLGHQGQINGGAIQGLGHAMLEEIALDGGQVTTANLHDYKMPSITDVPELTTVLVDAHDGVGPYRAKGIGEYSVEAVPAAVANAVADAVGVRITDLPVTAEKVYRALSAR